MPVYLAPYIGSGTDAEPFRPRGSDQPGWSAIDIRPNPAVITGFCLLYLPNADNDPQLHEIGMDKLESLANSARTTLSSRLGVTLDTGWTLGEAVGQLLMYPPTNGWKALRPYRNRFEAWLNNELFFALPVIAGGAITYQDNFNRADNPLGSLWTVSETGAMPVIVSNQVQNPDTTGTWGLARYTAASFNPDQWASIKAVTAVTSNTRGVGVVLRMVPGAQRNYYIVGLFGPLGASAERHIEKRVAGVATTLYSSVGAGASGTIVRGEARGPSIQQLLDGTSLTTVTDTSHNSGYPGCFCAANGGNPVTDAQLDDWLGGNLPLENIIGVGGRPLRPAIFAPGNAR